VAEEQHLLQRGLQQLAFHQPVLDLLMRNHPQLHLSWVVLTGEELSQMLQVLLPPLLLQLLLQVTLVCA
jgi:hypothetical protein